MSGPLRDPRHRLALRGEAAAARALERQGLAILDRRFRCRLGELDLVAQDGDTVVFVEVKTRRDTSRGRPAEAVTARKRQRLCRAARWWLARREDPEPPCRFDVVEVIERGGDLSVRHLRDAFRVTPTG